MNESPQTSLTVMPQQEQSSSMLALIDRAARDPGVDVAKMERLLAMAEKVHEREAKNLYDQALNAAQAEMRPISRDCHNPQTRSRYASYEQIDMAIRPIYTSHGFAMSFGSKGSQSQDRVLVTCRVSHRGGHTEHVELEMTADGKGAKGGDVQTKVHAIGSALSYAKRYISNLVWNLSFGEADDDGNAASQRPAKNRPADRFYREAPQAPSPTQTAPKGPASESRRRGVLEFLRESHQESSLIAYALSLQFIGDGMPLESWSLDNIPVSNAALNTLDSDITAWLEPQQPREQEQPQEDGEEMQEPFWGTVIHIPRKGQKRPEYLKSPDTIRSLYLSSKAGNEEDRKRLFGFVSNFEPLPYNGNPPSKEDFDLRVSLDLFNTWREERHETGDVPTP